MKRRDFVTVLSAAAVGWPLATRAQQSEVTRPLGARAQQPVRLRRIGMLMGGPENEARAKAFRSNLERLGWLDGKDVQIDYRWTNGSSTLMQKYAVELVSSQYDVIVCSSTPTLIALRKETQTIPIVFVMVSDPIGLGHVASMARPGGNVTGFTPFEPSLGGKWVELLKEIEPRTTRVALLFNPDTAANAPSFVQSAEAAGSALLIAVMPMPTRTDAEIERALANFAQQPGGGVVILPDPYTLARPQSIVATTMRHNLPMITPFREFTIPGAIASYGIDIISEDRRAASYVDRILRGEKPAELPVQAPTKFELVINRKTAKMLGIDIPATTLGRADEVIE